MDWLSAIIIGIVQGLTEFLPVSSTGHMILTAQILGIEPSAITNTFIISLHFGTVLAIFYLYWRNFFQKFAFYYKITIACLPLVFALILEKFDFVDALQSNTWVIAIALLLGGIFFLFMDKIFKEADKNSKTHTDHISYLNSFIIGLFQIIAIIPGVSRSAATIIGGITQKLDRKTAAEFSFFLSVPTVIAATGLKMIKNFDVLTKDHLSIIILGNIASFIVAVIAIKGFINFLTKHGFKLFGYYRIALGLIIIVLLALGYQLNVVE